MGEHGPLKSNNNDLKERFMWLFHLWSGTHLVSHHWTTVILTEWNLSPYLPTHPLHTVFHLILLTLLTSNWTYYEIVLIYKGRQWQISEIMVLPPPSVNCPPFWKQISWLVWHSNLDIILWKSLQRSLDYSNIRDPKMSQEWEYHTGLRNYRTNAANSIF